MPPLRSLARLVGLALLTSAATASAQTVINAVPFTISQSGKYVLGGNLQITFNGNAITVSAPNVILDLNGFYVSGAGNSTTTGLGVIQVNNVSNVTIRNGTVANGGSGIQFAGGANSVNHLVEKVNVTRCLISGIGFGEANANCIVRRCTISQIGGFTGGTVSAYGIVCSAGVRIEGNFINTVTDSASGLGISGLGVGIGMESSNVAGSFAIGNTIANCSVGVSRGKYQNNLTHNCATPFQQGINAGGND